MDILSRMQKLLLKIPKGRVTTYAEIASMLKIHPRHAGFLLSRNSEPEKYPCYKVVCSDGRLGGYSGPGGVRSKVSRLRRDGMKVDNNRVDLKRHMFSFK